MNNQKSYPQDQALENGNYCNQCAKCRDYFYGHKSRILCRECQDLKNSSKVSLMNNIDRCRDFNCTDSKVCERYLQRGRVGKKTKIHDSLARNFFHCDYKITHMRKMGKYELNS